MLISYLYHIKNFDRWFHRDQGEKLMSDVQSEFSYEYNGGVVIERSSRSSSICSGLWLLFGISSISDSRRATMEGSTGSEGDVEGGAGVNEEDSDWIE